MRGRWIMRPRPRAGPRVLRKVRRILMSTSSSNSDSPEFRREVLETYVSLFRQGDAEGLVSLFDPNATIEDPVGKPSRTGRDSIAEFFASAASRVKHATMEAPIRGSIARFAVVPLVFITESAGTWQRVSAVDVMEFDAAGKIVHMRAYHGPEDRREITAEAARASMESSSE